MKPTISGTEVITFPYETHDNIMQGSIKPTHRETQVMVFYTEIYLHFTRPESYLGCLDSDILYNLGDPKLATYILN